ncbi:MAG: YgcG family protein [Alphaproteobacteria bacterium]|nr:YgcG family protein [Alphaproteobacteria bacterium]
MNRILRFLLLLVAIVASPALAQKFPPLSGRVVDTAGLLNAQQQQALTQKLAGLEQASSRQLVVATVPDLQGYPIEDYGYKLGRAWGIGQKGANNGALLLVAPKEHKVRIEVGYGLEPILTDAFNKDVIDEKIVPAFKSGDYPGGINAGVDALVQQLQAPQEQAEKRAAAAGQKATHARRSSGSFVPLIFWGVIILFVILSMFRKRRKTYGRRYGRSPGVFLWGPGLGGWGSGGGSWGSGGGGWGGGGGGGFSGGGGSFGGGGASGSW